MTATEGPSAPISIYERFPRLREIEAAGKMPEHVAIIMDGNRRWVRQEFGNGAPAIQGHTQGMHNIVELLRDLRQLESIRYITLWAFSTENWNRDPQEIKALMRLFEEAIPMVLPEVKAANGRIIHLGRKDRLPWTVSLAIERAERETAENTGQTVCLAIDYGNDDQETRVLQKVLRKVVLDEVPVMIWQDEEAVTALRKKLLDTGEHNIPPIDLAFRTGGEQRTSGLPNAAYAEWYTIKAYLPDATVADFVHGIIDYADRDRRFGGNSPTK
jgi:undecaprenyl diphosphate synthase